MPRAAAIQLDERDIPEDLDWFPEFSMETCLQENLENYLTFLMRLEPLERDLLLLAHYSELKHSDIAKILGCPKSRMVQYLEAARLHLIQVLQGVPVVKPLRDQGSVPVVVDFICDPV